jgi:glutamate transport system permease protein
VLFGLVFGIVTAASQRAIVRSISASVIVEFCRAVPVLLLMIFFWRWFRLRRDCRRLVLGGRACA